MSREIKESNVYWIGGIPKQWKLVPTKRVLRGTKSIVGSEVDNYERLALTMNGVIKRNKEDNEGLQPEKFDNYQILRENELVFKLIDLQNEKTSRVGLSPFTGIVSPAYIVLTNEQSDNRFYYYWFFDMYNRLVFNQMSDDGVRANLNVNDLVNIPIPLISLSEQKAIADFLDKKCAEIDEMIALQEKIVEELKAYKQSVITEAVTKGLNPDVPMKDSGIPWIGDIPAHWNVCFIKQIMRNKSIKGYPDERVLSLYRDYGVVLKDSRDDNHNVTSDDTSSYKFVEVGDFVINKMKAWQGSMAVSRYQGIISPAYYICRFTTDKIDKEYIHHLLRNETYKVEYMRLSSGLRIGQWDLNIDDFLRIKMVLPPIVEQQAIAKHLEKNCTEIDNLISIKLSKIDSLKEYKKSIIYEYVTGKKEVTE